MRWPESGVFCAVSEWFWSVDWQPCCARWVGLYVADRRPKADCSTVRRVDSTVVAAGALCDTPVLYLHIQAGRWCAIEKHYKHKRAKEERDCNFKGCPDRFSNTRILSKHLGIIQNLLLVLSTSNDLGCLFAVQNK